MRRRSPNVASCALVGALWLIACNAPTRASAITQTTRFVTLPSSIAALSQAQNAPGLPGQISFGSAHGRSVLYLKFPKNLAARGVPLKAFIALSAREGAAVAALPVTVEAWRVSAPWQAAQLVAWSDKPPLALPYARAQLDGTLPDAQRIEVTELVRFAARNPELDFGIALLGRAGSGHGATFATGISGGVAPRLEIYVR